MRGGASSGSSDGRTSARIALLDRVLKAALENGVAKDDHEKALLEGLSSDLEGCLELIEGSGRDQARSDLPPDALRFCEVFSNSPDGFLMVDQSRRVVQANRSFCEMLGYSPAELRALDSPRDLTPSKWHDLEDEVWGEQVLGNGGSGIYEKEYVRKDGSAVPVELQAYSFTPDGGGTPYLWALVRDISERKKATEGKARLEAELLQAQKMEAVGKLAGGVAHDFNNLLTVINSYASFAIEDLEESDPVRADIMEIHAAGRRAAALVRQLLAFSRRQVMEIEVLDLDEIVRGMEKMVGRLLGEDIDLFIHSPEKLGSIRADAGQMEQVLVNLVVNARDAMPEGGRIVIETSDVEVCEKMARRHADLEPGGYVLLSVSDTGTGISDEIMPRLFDPFFTTKERGKGTGLGLATAYGIVKQTGGSILVESEVGSGSTFRVYLPRVEAAAPQRPVDPAPAKSRGRETVLVVEDEAAVRAVSERALRGAGYEVILAPNAGEALLLCETLDRPPHLLLTDVVLPHTSGKKLADRLSAAFPGIKVLFMSGYADDTIARHGIVNPGVKLIAKPFTAAELTQKVREVLDQDGATASRAS